MSEDVKLRQFWLAYPYVEDNGSKHKFIYEHNPLDIMDMNEDGGTKLYHVIELEPTLQLMKEMGEAIINEVRFDSKEEILEKYRKFLEGIEK